jgi:hypothetical protein
VGESGKGRGKYLRNLYLLLGIQLLVGWWFTDMACIEGGSFGEWVLNWDGFSFWTCLILVILLQVVGLLWRSAVASGSLSWLWYTIHTFAFAFLFAYFEAANGAENTLINYVFALAFWLAVSLFVHSLASKNEITF